MAALKAAFLFPLLFGFSGCRGAKTPRPAPALLINGAGASLPYILYSKWLFEYKKIKPSVSINYQSIGSSGGVRQFFKGTLDFGATDIPIPEKEIKAAGKPAEHIPAALGAVAIVYNLDLPQKAALRFDGRTLSKIFMGKIKQWNHPEIQALNKGAPLPAAPIAPIYRADGSGGTAFFTEFLSGRSEEFLRAVGRGKSVSWPAGAGGKGNEGSLGLASKIKGALAYTARSYALARGLPMAKIKNRSGRFVLPTEKSIRQAALSAAGQGGKGDPWARTLIDMPGKGVYPIAGFTYIILSPKAPKRKKEALADFLIWALGPGQAFSKKLRFVPLPENIRQAAQARLARIKAE